jgi:N-acetylmuramic acid 6-phosphate etherase
MTGSPERGTEAANPATRDFDLAPVLEQAGLMNAEDHRVADAVGATLPAVATAVVKIAECLGRGGRLLYVGAGTSGRLAALDAAECPPTFGTDPGMVQAVLAGGPRAMVEAIEGAEDDAAAGALEMDARGVGPADAVVGVAASGETPFTVAAVRRARRRGAWTAGVACNAGSSLEAACDLAIIPLVGPEVIAGSTRLKAGTAQKLVLNMLSTLAMVRLGKVYGNLMVDLRATNAKLRRRAARIVSAVAAVDEMSADAALGRAGGRVQVAIVMLRLGVDPDAARTRLEAAGGSLRRALGEAR